MTVSPQVEEYNLAVEGFAFRNIGQNLRAASSLSDDWTSLTVFQKLVSVLLVAIPVLYLLSPVDVISEMQVGLLGFLDDAVVVVFCLALVGYWHRRWMSSRAR